MKRFIFLLLRLILTAMMMPFIIITIIFAFITIIFAVIIAIAFFMFGCITGGSVVNVENLTILRKKAKDTAKK